MKPLFINLYLPFVIVNTLPSNQTKCRFYNNNLLAKTNHQEYTKHEINSLVPITPHLRICYTDWLQFCCDDKKLETEKLKWYSVIFHTGQKLDKTKPVFLNFPLNFIDSLMFWKSEMTENDIDSKIMKKKFENIIMSNMCFDMKK